jgi:hypothetical protein
MIERGYGDIIKMQDLLDMAVKGAGEYSRYHLTVLLLTKVGTLSCEAIQGDVSCWIPTWITFRFDLAHWNIH